MIKALIKVGIEENISQDNKAIYDKLTANKTSLVAQMVKHLTTMWEARVRSLGREDPLEKAWQPTPVLLPGKSHGRRSLVGYSPWGRKESDTTEQFHFLSFFSLFLST